MSNQKAALQVKVGSEEPLPLDEPALHFPFRSTSVDSPPRVYNPIRPLMASLADYTWKRCTEPPPKLTKFPCANILKCLPKIPQFQPRVYSLN